MDVSHNSVIQVKPEENRASDASSSLRHWLAAVDAVLRAVEETVWRLRREAVEACHAGREEWSDWAGGFRDAQSALQSWQQQTARLVSIGLGADQGRRELPIAPDAGGVCEPATGQRDARATACEERAAFHRGLHFARRGLLEGRVSCSRRVRTFCRAFGSKRSLSCKTASRRKTRSAWWRSSSKRWECRSTRLFVSLKERQSHRPALGKSTAPS